MTTQTQQPDKMTAAELRQAFQRLETENDEIRARLQLVTERLDLILDGLTMATTAAASPAAMATAEFIAESITLDYMDGKPVYKAKGGRFTKFGVRIWPEVLPVLGIDPKTLSPGANPITPTTYIVEIGSTGQPRKVTGKK